MNDEPLIRMRPRKSKHETNENPRNYTRVLRSSFDTQLAASLNQVRADTFLVDGEITASRFDV
jgi:hypothetical protein